MAPTGLQVRVKQGREHAPVAHFTATLNSVIKVLGEIDMVYLMDAPRAKWVIERVDTEGADLIVRITARRLQSEDRTAEDMLVPVEAFVDGIAALQQEPAVPRLFAPTTVTRLSKMGVPTNGVNAVSLATYNGTVGTPSELSDIVRAHAKSAVRPMEESIGSVRGTLFSLRKRQGRSKRIFVTVRDAVGGQAIEGTVTEALSEDLRAAWGNRVILAGKVRRNAQGQVVRIDADRLEQLPGDNSVRPSTAEILGIGAAWLDGNTVDEYVRQVRDG